MVVTLVKWKMDVKKFSASILGETVNFHVLKLQQSFFLWVGTRPSLTTLAVAINTRFNDQPISTHLLGDTSDVTSSALAKKLAKKTKCQCFVSINIPDSSLYLSTEEYIINLIEKDPSTFYFESPQTPLEK